MSAFALLLLISFAVTACGVEEVPRASGIRNRAHEEVRRAPVYKPQNTIPRAHGFRRTSTGVRRAPHTAESSPAPRQQKLVRAPLSVPVIPLPAMMPMGFPLVTFPPMGSLPTLPTFATIAMPTLPSLTMPPSFQRLLGITTTSSPRKPAREISDRDREERARRPAKSVEVSAERNDEVPDMPNNIPQRLSDPGASLNFSSIRNSTTSYPLETPYICVSDDDSSSGLSPVSSRLPKFVNPRKVPIIVPESNADWIVPF